MENTLERIAKCRYKTQMDKRSGFWQVDLTAAAQELLAFITPKGRVFQWKVMPFGVANASALFQELMNKVLYILRRRPLVQELISRGAEMEAHIDDVSLGTNTQEDHVLLLCEFFIVCQENHLRIKLEKCEFMKEEMKYFGFDVGYGWWKPAASKMQPLQDMQIRDDPKKGLHDVRSFVGACNFYRRHIHNFTYSSAPLTDLIKKTTPWRWTAREEECFQELKKKIASSNCLGVTRPKGEIVLITDASDVGGGGTIYQWQELNPAELTHCHYPTNGLNRDGSLKHDYPTSEWRLVPLGHWNWIWNQARFNYSTYDQELLAGMLVLSSQSRLLGSIPIVWLCDEEPVKSFQKGPPPEKARKGHCPMMVTVDVKVGEPGDEQEDEQGSDEEGGSLPPRVNWPKEGDERWQQWGQRVHAEMRQGKHVHQAMSRAARICGFTKQGGESQAQTKLQRLVDTLRKRQHEKVEARAREEGAEWQTEVTQAKKRVRTARRAVEEEHERIYQKVVVEHERYMERARRTSRYGTSESSLRLENHRKSGR